MNIEQALKHANNVSFVLSELSIEGCTNITSISINWESKPKIHISEQEFRKLFAGKTVIERRGMTDFTLTIEVCGVEVFCLVGPRHSEPVELSVTI